MKNKRGYTLIELIVVVALVSVIGLIAYSILGQGFSLFASQSKSANEQADMRQILSDITNIARVTDPQAIKYESEVLYIGDHIYTFEGGQVKRNGSVIADDIASFGVTIQSTADKSILLIEIVNTSGKNLSTSISLERWEKNL